MLIRVHVFYHIKLTADAEQQTLLLFPTQRTQVRRLFQVLL